MFFPTHGRESEKTYGRNLRLTPVSRKRRKYVILFVQSSFSDVISIF